MNGNSQARRVARILALALVLLPGLALAQQAKLNVQVASVSNQGNQVDAPLKQMQEDFKRNGLSFTSFKLVGSQTLSLNPGQSGSVSLPNGTASVTFLRKDADGRLAIRISAPKVSTEVALDRELTVNVGEHNGAKLFLIVRK